MEAVQRQELHLRDYLRLIRKRYRLILACVVLTTALAVVYSLMTPNLYQARATVQVQGQSGYVIRATPTFDESGVNLTPNSLTELIGSQSYQELASSVMNLAEGYDLDLTARRSQDDMVGLFEEDLMKKGLPIYFARLALQASRNPRGKLKGIGVGVATQAEEALRKNPAPSDSSIESTLSSVEKDEVIKQAGALADLARRFNVDLFRLSADEIEPHAIRIMNDSRIRGLPNNPLRGRRWEQLPPLERSAAVQAAYREIPKRKPDEIDKKLKAEKYATRELKDTGMLTISFDSLDKFRAMNGADAMVCVIIWKNQYSRKEAAQRIRQVAEYALYGEDGSGGVKARLDRVNQELRNFKIDKKMPDLEAVRTSRASQFYKLQNEYQSVNAGIDATKQQIAAYQAELKQIPRTIESPTVSDNPTVAALEGELISAKAELQSEQAQFTDEHPRVLAQLSKVSRLENEIKAAGARQPKSAQVNESPNPMYGEFYENLKKAETDLVIMEHRKGTLYNQLKQAQALVAQLPNTEYQVSDIIGNQETLGAYMQQLGGKYLEAQLNEATKTSPARVVDLALEPGKKIKPRRTVNVILALMLGLFMGLVSSVLAESMDSRLRTREEVERALPSIPVLTAIPTFTGDHPLVVTGPSHPVVTEAYRRLRSSIRFVGVERPLRSIVVTSPSFGEGKSTVAANLAAAFAQSGQTVILVDADLRKPVQHQIMGVDNLTGLTTLLLGDDPIGAVLKPTEVTGLSILPSGPVPPNPTELLDSAAMRQLMVDLCEHADIVIFDTAPVSVVTDASILGSLADGVVLVAGGGITSRDTLMNAKEILDQARVRLLGAVLNRADLSNEEGGYRLYERYSDKGGPMNGHRKTELPGKTKALK